MNTLSSIDKEITRIQNSQSQLMQAILANPASRIGELNLRAQNNDLDEEEKAELSALKDEVQLFINSITIKSNVQIEELEARRDQLTKRQTESPDVVEEKLNTVLGPI